MMTSVAAKLTHMLLLTVIAAVPAGATGPQRKVDLNLELKELTTPLQTLTPADQQVVEQAIQAIKANEHGLALAYLSKLSSSNPMNSTLRILRAYVLIEVGNIAGALNEARTAESSGPREAYRCWFLAQVAYIAGNNALCRREIKHLAGDAPYTADVEKLRSDLRARAQ